jgi:hypothetical protein
MSSESTFRRIALGLDGAIEGAHMSHPDFRAHGRIFATLHHDRLWGMVKLTPDQQRLFVRDHPESFKPEPGAWGRNGCTAVELATVDEDTLGEALTLAWQESATAKTRSTKHKTGNAKRPSSKGRR